MAHAMPAPLRPRQLWSLLLMLLLAMCCLAGPRTAAAHSHHRTFPNRALQATNRTGGTRPAQQGHAASSCGTKPPSPEMRQLIRDRIAAVNAAAAKPAAAAAAGRVGIAAAAQTPGLQRATSITIGLVLHIISDRNVRAHIDFDNNNVVDAGETFDTAPHRAANPGDLPTCAHLKGELLSS
jgi:hypothetical protein